MLLFDTVVIAVTLYHMLETWHLQKELKSMQRMLILQQGRLCPCAIIIGEIMVEKKYVIGILHYMYVPDLQLHIVMC